MSSEYARSTMFGQRVVHAPFVSSLMEGLINAHPELRSAVTNLCYYGLDRMRVTRPVFIGDTIRVRRTVAGRREKSEVGGIVEFEDCVYQQQGQLAMVCRTLEYIRRRGAD
jgi:3-hydroxybutyryl-CoA dehydratase